MIIPGYSSVEASFLNIGQDVYDVTRSLSSSSYYAATVEICIVSETKNFYKKSLVLYMEIFFHAGYFYYNYCLTVVIAMCVRNCANIPGNYNHDVINGFNDLSGISRK